MNKVTTHRLYKVNSQELTFFLQETFQDFLSFDPFWSERLSLENTKNTLSLSSLEELDKQLSKQSPNCVIIRIPGSEMNTYLDGNRLVDYIRNTRSTLFLTTDLAPEELPLHRFPPLCAFMNFFAENHHLLFVEQSMTTSFTVCTEDVLSAEECMKRRQGASLTLKIALQLKKSGMAVRYLGLLKDPLHKQARKILQGYGRTIVYQGKLSEEITSKWVTNFTVVNENSEGGILRIRWEPGHVT
jgi:hypothetical protein